MNRKHLVILLYIMGIISAGIAVYQFIDGRPFPAALSIVFSSVFLFNGMYNQRKIKKEG